MLNESACNWFRSEIDRVAEQKLDAAELQLFKSFSHHLIHIHLADTLLAWRPEDMFAALYGLFGFLGTRRKDEAKIRVFNPTQEQHGWQSPHTVIYVCQRDMPFLVDSMRMALHRLGLNLYLFESQPAWVRRNADGVVQAIVKAAPGSNRSEYIKEDFAFLQIDHQSDAAEREAIQAELQSVLADVVCSVDDYQPMLKRLDTLIEEFEQQPQIDPEDTEFLRWLRKGNFTLLGISEFQRGDQASGFLMQEQAGKRLGLMRQRDALAPAALEDLSPGFAAFYQSDASLAFTKSSHKSTVHRAVYSDYVIAKRRGQHGEAIGEVRLLGLYTSQLYHRSIWDIPLVRKKAAWLVEHSRFDPGSHDGKAYAALLEAHPRDELIQTDNEELLQISLGIWRIYDRRAVRLFTRIDPFEKFASCIIYLPKENLSTETRELIEQKLRTALDAEPGEFSTQFLTESVLARIHYVFRIKTTKYQSIDHSLLEQQVVDLTRDWSSALREEILNTWDASDAPAINRKWGSAFAPAYQNEFTLAETIADLECITALDGENSIGVRFFNESGTDEDIMRLKLFRKGQSMELSELIPMLENLGFRVLVEHPHQIRPRNDELIWMHDFTLRFTMDIQGTLDIGAVREQFQQAFLAVWQGNTANDGFNRLVLGARLDWQSAALFRSYAHYLKQLGSPFSLGFIADVLARHLEITRNLLALFRFKFDPRLYAASSAEAERAESDDSEPRSERVQRISEKIIAALDSVQNRNEDELIRQYLEMMQATLRTGFFQTQSGNEQPKPYVALKLATGQLEFAPRPRPAYEVYVYSPFFEGVHLRGGKVARGGIRWSDRLEDYRTEILGLVKAQQVKNAVIVPTGAKGGFIARRALAAPDREAWLAEGIASYKSFIQGLLDITDNRVGNDIVHPDNVVCADDDDPYLVVAADKGTASFSDIANELSDNYGHWLGDAFASGGSNGYDHKGMGITARGAWVAVQRHFRELGLDVQKQSISVIGIGDMSGDVFGNGMLLSEQLRVVAAFNHMHIFIDPDPDPAVSFAERQRLFALPRSGWADYKAELISAGGGVFSREQKSIALSPQMQALLDCDDSRLQPDELIHRLLQARVDLIWNGGVGTYVKASSESDSAAGDRANDSLRVNGSQLRCRVFGEGGNLGLTQMGRIEFCQNGGICNTDFIDNAGGVDCSDNEVNIKIALAALLEDQRIDQPQRNALLRDMTDDVARLVLHSNYRQTLAISLAQFNRKQQHHEYQRFLQHMEDSGQLDRALEYLPDDERIKELHSKGLAWTRPELSVLISYAKVALKEALIPEQAHTDPYLVNYLYTAFPQALIELSGQSLETHRLATEIIATRVANDMVNRMGFTYCYRLMDSLGVSAAEVSRSFIVVMELFDLDALWKDIEALDYRLESALQHELLQQLVELGRRASRWYLRNRRTLQPAAEIDQSRSCFARLLGESLGLHQPQWRIHTDQHAARLMESNVPAAVAERCAALPSFFLFPGTVDVALQTGRDAADVTRLCFSLTASLQLDWLMQSLGNWQAQNRWQDLARESHLDELEALLRQLTLGLLASAADQDIAAIEEGWRQQQQASIQRFVDFMSGMRSSKLADLSVVTVALRELKSLVDLSC